MRVRDHELFVRDGFDIHVMARDAPPHSHPHHSHSLTPLTPPTFLRHQPPRTASDTASYPRAAPPLTQVRLTLAEAVLGGRVVVPTLEGQAAPQLPPGAVHPLSRTRP